MKGPRRSKTSGILATLKLAWLLAGAVLLLGVGLELLARQVAGEPAVGHSSIEVAATEWSPYVEYRTRAQRGRSLEVAPGGYRRTWIPPTAAADAATVLCLGGDVLWGLGADDLETIPSLLARRLASSGHDVHVVNQAQPGWVGTQEVLALILELRDGRVPDLVVFCDGIRDVQSAWRTGEAGLPLDHDLHVGWWKPAVRASDPPGVLYTATAKHLLRGTLRLLGGGDEVAEPVAMRRRPAARDLDDEALARSIVEVYHRNLELVDGLARTYGFPAIWYLEPSPFTRAPRSPIEQELHASLEDLGGLMAAVRERVHELEARPGPARFVDLAGLLDGRDGAPFRGLCQLDATGREAIAARLADDLEPLLGDLEGSR